ncbi:MAG: ribonuclease J [Clostridia bacterium]|nr:ribonuclease J [Clostridia bacterium]
MENTAQSARKYGKVFPPSATGNENTVRIAFIGGLNEIGKNCTLIECGNEMILIDCGLEFPDQSMLGVDVVVPDFTYLERNAGKVKAIFVTHGHEDHIGSLPYLLKTVNRPIYATKLTCGLINGKLREHGLENDVKMNMIVPGDVVKVGSFSIEAIHVNHSIPDALAFAIRTPAGLIVHTGDFKIDSTPIDGDIIDLPRFAELGKEGVLCLMCESTNAEKAGFTESEKKVGKSLEKLFEQAGERRILVATFASNIHRVQQIINIAAASGRKVSFSGRSLENVVQIGSELGYLDVPEDLIVPVDTVKNYPDSELVIITTGSQGEPMSALSRMAMNEHRKVSIGPNDFVIISAKPIPGNEKMVSNVVNELMKLGAEVIYQTMYEVHVSGHACQEELKLIMGLTKPKFFIPVHGEQKHLQHNAALATEMGIPSENIIIGDIGSVVELSQDSICLTGTVPSGKVFVDSSGAGDVASSVIRDRRKLAVDGILIVSCSVSPESGLLMSEIDISSKGFVYVRDAREIFEVAESAARACVEKNADSSKFDLTALKIKVRDEVGKAIYEKTKRNPIVVAAITCCQ